jgi:hypothetical protein
VQVRRVTCKHTFILPRQPKLSSAQVEAIKPLPASRSFSLYCPWHVHDKFLVPDPKAASGPRAALYMYTCSGGVADKQEDGWWFVRTEIVLRLLLLEGYVKLMLQTFTCSSRFRPRPFAYTAGCSSTSTLVNMTSKDRGSYQSVCILLSS